VKNEKNNLEDRENEIIYRSDDLIEFGDFPGYEGGSYRIKIFNRDNEIRTFIQSYDSGGNADEIWQEDLPGYEKIAKRIWRMKK
jgi:hypothetical protein